MSPAGRKHKPAVEVGAMVIFLAKGKGCIWHAAKLLVWLLRVLCVSGLKRKVPSGIPSALSTPVAFIQLRNIPVDDMRQLGKNARHICISVYNIYRQENACWYSKLPVHFAFSFSAGISTRHEETGLPLHLADCGFTTLCFAPTSQ